jgi:hypothetical protein
MMRPDDHGQFDRVLVEDMEGPVLPEEPLLVLPVPGEFLLDRSFEDVFGGDGDPVVSLADPGVVVDALHRLAVLGRRREEQEKLLGRFGHGHRKALGGQVENEQPALLEQEIEIEGRLLGKIGHRQKAEAFGLRGSLLGLPADELAPVVEETEIGLIPLHGPRPRHDESEGAFGVESFLVHPVAALGREPDFEVPPGRKRGWGGGGEVQAEEEGEREDDDEGPDNFFRPVTYHDENSDPIVL